MKYGKDKDDFEAIGDSGWGCFRGDRREHTNDIALFQILYDRERDLVYYSIRGEGHDNVYYLEDLASMLKEGHEGLLKMAEELRRTEPQVVN